MRQIPCGGLALALTLAATGCSHDATACTGAACGSTPPGQTSFESDLLGGTNNGRGALNPTSAADSGAAGSGAATAAPSVGTKGQSANDASTSAPGAAERAISEADIIQAQGDRLYALSRVAGLAVIDVSQPRALKLLGRYRELPATPFEMYLKDDVALVMFSGWGEYAAQEDGSYQWVSTSKLLALDVADAANISTLGSFDVPGSISDSRVVGDILYIVSHQDGYCWRCVENKQLTAISSLRVSDPRKVTKIDELDYEDGNASWGPRSVSVTNQRMYVAGPEYGSNQPENSTIQVIDISDPAGDLVEGAQVKVAGQVNTRWQMDEYQGVLRVVSQPWLWWGAQTITSPAVQTFKVESSQKLSALGRTEIQLPMRESLRSVRFDGARGYAITAEQKDPLFTLDLSDPAHPRQVGELELPGFVTYMEPRGERLLGLGFDQGNPAGSIAVSLFDVKDLTAPKLLSRANFGGTWGSLPEDQDRLHKVFRVLDDAGLILVPFSGWQDNASAKTDGCYTSTYVGGVQLVDFKDDALKARGATPSVGETRRALLVHDNLLSVGDERVQAFDIADRDQPQQVSQVVLSRYVTRALALDSGVVARFESDYTKGGMRLSVVAKNGADDPNQSLAEVSLSDLALGKSLDACSGGFELRETFARGSQLEVLYNTWTNRADGTNGALGGLLVLDVSKADKPSVLSNTQWSDAGDSWSPYYGFYSYGFYGSPTPVIRTEHSMAMLEASWRYDAIGGTSTQKVRLRVLDLRDSRQVKQAELALPASDTTQYSGLVADGDVVMTSHFESTNADATRGRFYIDRFDLSEPAAPKRLGAINVPGALMSFDAAHSRAITSEQVRVSVPDLTAEECYQRFASASWGSPQTGNVGSGVAVRSASAPVATGGVGGSGGSASVPVEQPKATCLGYKQRLHLVQLSGDLATLEDTYNLADDQQVYSSSMGDGVLFASLGRGGYYYPRTGIADVACFGPCGGGGVVSKPAELLVLGGFDAGKLVVGHIQVPDTDKASAWWGFWGSPSVYVSGKLGIMVGQSDVAIIDASDAGAPRIAKRVPLVASAYYVDVHPESALLTLGQQGVQWIELK